MFFIQILWNIIIDHFCPAKWADRRTTDAAFVLLSEGPPGHKNRAPKLLSSHCLYQTEFDEYNTPIYGHHLFSKTFTILYRLHFLYQLNSNIIWLRYIIINLAKEEFIFILLIYNSLFSFLLNDILFYAKWLVSRIHTYI